MPRTNPDTSFDVAVRHLFRHLGDAAQLRRNPIVRRFFISDGRRVTVARQRTAIAAIMRTIDRSSEQIRVLDIASGKDEQAFRQRTIIRRTYFERLDLERIAMDLGLSPRQYYRERAAICARIARSIELRPEADTTSTSTVLDPLRLHMDRASQRFELGDGDGAASEYRRAFESAKAAETRIDILCRMAEICIEQSYRDAAELYLRNADVIHATNEKAMSVIARDAARCHILLMQSRLAWQRGRGALAERALADASRIAEAILPSGGSRVRKLCIEVLLESTQRNADVGQFASALSNLSDAFYLLNRSNEPSLRQKSDAIRLRTILEMTTPDAIRTAEESTGPLLEAIGLARSCGSAKRAVLAFASLSAVHRYARQHKLALDVASRSTGMAKQFRLPAFRASVAIVTGDALGQTSYWRRGLRMIAGVERVLARGSAEWVKCSLLRAEYLFRLEQWEGGYVLGRHCQRYARAIGSRRLEGASLRCMALASHELGRAADAHEYLSAAIPILEQHGSAGSRDYAYRVFERIQHPGRSTLIE